MRTKFSLPLSSSTQVWIHTAQTRTKNRLKFRRRMYRESIWYVQHLSLSSVPAETGHTIQPASRANCHIGFAQVAASLPEPHVESVVPVLIEVLRDIPRMDFDQCLVWDGMFHSTALFRTVLTMHEDWAIPDQLVYNTVSSLLRLASAHPEHRIPVTDVILDFTSKIVTLLQNEHRA